MEDGKKAMEGQKNQIVDKRALTLCIWVAAAVLGAMAIGWLWADDWHKGAALLCTALYVCYAVLLKRKGRLRTKTAVGLAFCYMRMATCVALLGVGFYLFFYDWFLFGIFFVVVSFIYVIYRICQPTIHRLKKK